MGSSSGVTHVMKKHSSVIIERARSAAESRLRDLMHEIRLLLLAFPHLRDAFDKDELPITFIVAKGSGRLTKRRTVRRQSRGIPRGAVR